MAEAAKLAEDVQPAKGVAGARVDSLSTVLRRATAQMLADSRLGSSAYALLNAFLKRYIAWPYRATPGRAFDSMGVESSEFGSLVYASSEDLTRVPADVLACAIDVHQTLGLEELRTSYARIAEVKKLAKSPPPRTSPNIPVADATMGVIFAMDSNVPLETLAEELQQLNRQHSHRHWVDMVVVVARGTIHYVCQFPHQPLGTFLPPAREAFVSAAMYVHIFARPHAEFSLNRMCAVLFPYLHFFSPGTSLPPYPEALEGVPKTGLTIAPYQANLKGDLVPVPTELRFNQFFLFPLGFSVEDRKGELLAKVQYLPWQDGGVVRVIGKLPIEGLLIFAGADALKQPVIRIGGEQISGVIPLSREHFIEMAERTARQSNLVIKPDERPKWVVEKRDEGTTSPFIARLYMGILRLRDLALSDATEREQFDNAFQGVIAGLENIRAAAKTAVELYSSHSKRVARGEIARVVGGIVFLDENVDHELRKQTEIVISTAGRVVKDRMQEVFRTLNLDIGFLYKKPSTFATGIAKLQQQDISLANYLEQTRAKWSEQLKKRRDGLEHGSWVLPKIVHEPDSGSVRSIEPLVDGQPVTQFVSHIVDRTCCFIEELCAYALQRRMPEGISFAEIPPNERKPEIVERFRPALAGGGMPIWALTYHDSKFEDT